MSLRRALRQAIAVTVVLASTGCDDGFSLLVDLKTDVRPGIEFTQVVTLVDDAEGGASEASFGAFTNQDYLEGLRIAEIDGLPEGTTVATVRLIDRDGAVVLQRRTVVELRDDTGITVLMTRDCTGVMCPLADDDPALSECLGGRCVRPECYVENPDQCPAGECASDLECSFPAACAIGACVDGWCFARTDDTVCREGEWCHPEDGCSMLDPRLRDGGTTTPDAGPCVDGDACTTGRGCEIGTVDCTTGSPVCQPTGIAPAGTTCREPVSECDEIETCDGTSTACPADTFAPTGTSCSAGTCDGLGNCGACTEGAPCATPNPCETGTIQCSGDTATCVGAGPVPAGTECRPAIDVCDVAEACDGSSTACPADGFASSSVECRAATDACDRAESCTGSSATCPVDALVSAGTECRAPAGPCDVAEACTGSSGSCPADVLAASGVTCRPTAGGCDTEEQCDGTSAACPMDRFVASGTGCRASAGACDVAEACSGTSATCPADGFATSGVCRGSAGPCDVAESCNGSGPDCPADGFAGGGMCRGASGACDTPEYCTGSSANCPPNGYLGGSVVCRPSGGACDLEERCSGSSPDCPPDQSNDGAVCQFRNVCGSRPCRYCEGFNCTGLFGGFDSSCNPTCGGLNFFCGGGSTCCPSGTCSAGVHSPPSGDCGGNCCIGTGTCL